MNLVIQLKLPKELEEKLKGKKIIPLIPKKISCPVCKIELHWTPTNARNIFKGNCPNCNMGFTYLNGNIIGGIKVSQ